MRYRRLDVNNDYTIGQGSANFWINSPDGVRQSVLTRLRLWEGEWFLDKTEGTPYSQEILGYGTQPFYDLAIKQRVLGTLNVTEIVEYSSVFDPETRILSIPILDILTSFSKNLISVITNGPIVLAPPPVVP